MPISFEVERFNKAVESIGVKVRSPITSKKAILAAAKIIKDEIVERAPKRTGNLKANIVITEISKDKNGDDFVYVGPDKKDTFYGPMLEFGTSKMKPKPFVEPSFRSKKNEALEAMAKVVREELEDV